MRLLLCKKGSISHKFCVAYFAKKNRYAVEKEIEGWKKWFNTSISH